MKTKMVLTQEEIKKIIPHRDPILLIDEVVEMTGDAIVAKFYVSPYRDLFRGHFPDEPIFPGIYTIECMAQASDILILSMEQYAEKLPLFLGVDNVNFKKKITPDTNLIIKSKIVKHNAAKGVLVCSSEVFIDDDLAASGDVALAIR